MAKMTDRREEDGRDSGGRDRSREWRGGRGKSELLSRGCVQVFSVSFPLIPPFTQEEGKAQKSELPKVTHPAEPGPEGSVWKPDHRLVSLIPATARYQTMER